MCLPLPPPAPHWCTWEGHWACGGWERGPGGPSRVEGRSLGAAPASRRMGSSPSPWRRGGRRGRSRPSSCRFPGQTCVHRAGLRGGSPGQLWPPAAPRPPGGGGRTWCTRPPSRGRGRRGSARHGCTGRSGCSTCSTPPSAASAAAAPAAQWPGCAARPGWGQGDSHEPLQAGRPGSPPTPRHIPGQGAAAAAGRVQAACGRRGQVTPGPLPARGSALPLLTSQATPARAGRKPRGAGRGHPGVWPVVLPQSGWAQEQGVAGPPCHLPLLGAEPRDMGPE